MKIFQKIIIVCFASIVWQVSAAELIDKSIPAEGINSVSIENLRGKVTIIGWDKKEVSVKGELDKKSERFIFEKQGTNVIIKVIMPHQNNYGWNDKGSDLTIQIPKDSRMNFSGVSTDVLLHNLISSSEVNTVSGNITARNLKQYIELSTVSGDIESEKLSGKIRLSSVSGDIDDKSSQGRLIIKLVSGEIESQSTATEVLVNNVSGSVKLMLNEVDELEISTVSGYVHSQLALNNRGVVKLSSVSGDMNILFQSTIDANFRLNASVGGLLENKLTSDKSQRAKYGPSSKLYFQTGAGAASVKASTVSGTIKVYR
jgi:hypothetical protein